MSIERKKERKKEEKKNGWGKVMMRLYQIVLLCFLPVYLTPVCYLSHLWYRVTAVQNSVVFRKRLTSEQLIWCLLMIMKFWMSTPFRLIGGALVFHPTGKIARLGSFLIAIIFTIPAMWLSFARCWLLFYDLKLSRASAKRQWKAHLADTLYLSINPELSKSNADFAGPGLIKGNSQSHGFALASADSSPIPDHMNKSPQPSPVANSSRPSRLFLSLPTIGLRSASLDSQVKGEENGNSGATTSHTQTPDTTHEPSKSRSKSETYSLNQSGDLNWYIQYGQSFGNPGWVFQRAGLAAIVHICVIVPLLVMANMIRGQFWPPILYFLSQVPSLGLLIGFLALYWDSESVASDFLLFRYELACSACVSALRLFGLIFLILIGFFIQPGSTGVIFPVSLYILFTDGVQMGYLFVLLKIIPEKLKSAGFLTVYLDASILPENTKEMAQQIDVGSSRGLVAARPTSSRATSIGSNRIMSVKEAQSILENLITDNTGFQAFMAHLIREFSSECLLSVVEFLQFKQHIADKLEMAEDNPDSNSAMVCREVTPMMMMDDPENIPGFSPARILATMYASASERSKLGSQGGSRKSLSNGSNLRMSSLIELGSRLVGSERRLTSTKGIEKELKKMGGSERTLKIGSDRYLGDSDLRVKKAAGPGSPIPKAPSAGASGSALSLSGGAMSNGGEIEEEENENFKCPSKLRRVNMSEFDWPKCVRMSGLMVILQQEWASEKQVCKALFDKYIHDDAPYQINISFRTRNQVMGILIGLGVIPPHTESAPVGGIRRLRSSTITSRMTRSNSQAAAAVPNHKDHNHHHSHRKRSTLDKPSSMDDLNTGAQHSNDIDNDDDDRAIDHLNPPKLKMKGTQSASSSTGSTSISGPKEEWLHQLSHVFDAIVDEMFLLMAQSCQRFMDTPEYSNWLDRFEKRNTGYGGHAGQSSGRVIV